MKFGLCWLHRVAVILALAVPGSLLGQGVVGPNGQTPRPFYNFAHNPNEISNIQEALDAGANALEPDLMRFGDAATDPGGNFLNLDAQIKCNQDPTRCSGLYVYHDHCPGPLCNATASTNRYPATFEEYLEAVHALVFEGRYKLALIVLNIKPAGQSLPLASTLNSLDGRIKSNAAIVPAGTAGAVSVFASNATHVILDINGYFVPVADPTALAFYPITPCRIADTRSVAGPLGGPSLGGGTSRTFPIRSACGLPATAQAYSLNFTAVPGGPMGYLTAWPTGPARPLASSLNALTGAVTANAAIVPAGTAESIDVFASDATNLVIDMNGYFAPMATSAGPHRDPRRDPLPPL